MDVQWENIDGNKCKEKISSILYNLMAAGRNRKDDPQHEAENERLVENRVYLEEPGGFWDHKGSVLWLSLCAQVSNSTPFTQSDEAMHEEKKKTRESERDGAFPHGNTHARCRSRRRRRHTRCVGLHSAIANIKSRFGVGEPL